jgi:hypothetical protein
LTRFEEAEVAEQVAAPGWAAAFDERQLKEIEFSRLYAQMYRHGTDGHNAKLIVARMAELLDERDTAAQSPAANRPYVGQLGDDGDAPAVRIDGLERVVSRLLTVVFWTLSEAGNAGEGVPQMQVRLEAALRQELGIDQETIVALLDEEAQRRAGACAGRLSSSDC